MVIPFDLRNYKKNSWGASERASQNATPANDSAIFEDMASSLRVLTALRTVGRGTSTRVIAVGTSPVSILKSSKGQGCTIINPTTAIGLTSTTTILPSTVIVADGNTQLTSLGVANYDSLQLFLNVSAIVGGPSLEVYAQAQDPMSLAWVDTQLIFSVATTGTSYANLGNNGVATNFALRWVLTAVGAESITVTVSAVLKGGLGGNASGSTASSTVYIGVQGVTTTAGWPLLEGQSRDIFVEENSELFAIADTTANIKVIEW